MVRLINTNTYNKKVQGLIEQLDRELWDRIGDKQAQYIGYNVMLDDDPSILITVDGEPAACGCLRVLDNNKGEVKRMYVTKQHRGKGLGKQILKGIEQLAAENEVNRLILETHPVLKEAISLYEKNGFEHIDQYYPYIGNPDSVCMGKKL